jgi:hypothetical protein
MTFPGLSLRRAIEHAYTIRNAFLQLPIDEPHRRARAARIRDALTCHARQAWYAGEAHSNNWLDYDP